MYGYLSCIETIIQLQNRMSSARNETCKLDFVFSQIHTLSTYIFLYSLLQSQIWDTF